MALTARTSTQSAPADRAHRAAGVSQGRWRVPSPLLLLMAAAVIAALAWTCVLPPIQGPDEDSHVAYVQKIAEAHTIPWVRSGTPAKPGLPYSTELAYALTYGDVTPAWSNPAARPGRTPADERIWRSHDERLPARAGADGGFTTAMRNPPLYYLYAALPYEATSGLGIFDRVFAMRLANIPPLLAIVVFTWLLAGELLGRRRWAQTLATAAVALQPQLLNMTAVVNPDVFLAAIWAAALYVMTVTVKRGLGVGRLIALAALVVASCLTQPRGLAIVIPAAATLAIALWRRHTPRRRWLRWTLIGAGAVVVVAGVGVMLDYALLGHFTADRVRQFGSYLWQFYLPRLGFMAPSVSPGYGVREVFVNRFFGGFATLDANFSQRVYAGLAVIALAVAVLAAVGVVLHRRRLRRRLDVVVVCLLTAVGYMLVLHVAAFRSLLQSPDPVITGRYLLPLLPLFGVTVALAVIWLPRRWAPVAAGLLLAGVVVLQLSAVGVLFARFYA